MSALTFQSLSAVPRRSAAPARRNLSTRAVAPVELSAKNEDRYAAGKAASQRKKLALAVAAVVAVGLHVTVVLLVNRPMEIKPLPRKVPEMALEIAPPPPPAQVEPPKPVPQAVQPKVAARPAPANLPVVQNPVPDSEPSSNTVQVAQAQPPAPPAPPAPPPPEPVTEPKGYAGYLNNPAPTYPSAAQLRHLQGRVVLKVHVLASGQPDSVDVAQSSGYDILDQAAIKAVTAWSFDPAKRGQKAIDGWVNIPINFKLS
jgi:protein TonB